MDWMVIIQTFGFPIACVVACGIFISKIYWDNQENNKTDKERLYTVLADVNTTNQAILSANKEILESNRELMQEIKRDISDIKVAVSK